MQIAHLGHGLWINLDAVASIHDQNKITTVVMLNSGQHALAGHQREVMKNLLLPTVQFYHERTKPAEPLPPQITPPADTQQHDDTPPPADQPTLPGDAADAAPQPVDPTLLPLADAPAAVHVPNADAAPATNNPA